MCRRYRRRASDGQEMLRPERGSLAKFGLPTSPIALGLRVDDYTAKLGYICCLKETKSKLHCRRIKP